MPKVRLSELRCPGYLPHIGHGWLPDKSFGLGSIARARSYAKNLLGSFHVAITKYGLPRHGILVVWVSEIKSSETGRGSRYIDTTIKRG